MIAELEIHRGGKVEAVDIEREVVRIGGSDEADIVLPGLAPHAATLHVNDDRWTLANRTTRAIKVGRRSIPAGGRGPVRIGELLQLRHDLLLRLRPPRRTPATAAISPSTAARSQLKTLCALSLVVSALVVFVLLPFLPGDGEETSRQSSISRRYHDLTGDLVWAAAEDSSVQPVLVAMQQGRMAELRRDYSLASICYSQVAQSLLRDRMSSGDDARDLQGRLTEFVKGRLRELANYQPAKGAF